MEYPLAGPSLISRSELLRVCSVFCHFSQASIRRITDTFFAMRRDWSIMLVDGNSDAAKASCFIIVHFGDRQQHFKGSN